MARLIVVTGGTKGIGRAVILKFASQGFDVCTCARKQDELDKLALEVKTTHKVSVSTCQADLSTKAGVDRFAEFVNRLNRPIDVLVNNAGYFVPGTVTEEPDGTLESMMNANLFSAYHLVRRLIGNMKEKKQGHIFNMCSIASIKAYPNGGSYAITKFAMLGFSKVLREELKGDGIRVTSVLPGATLTASWEGTELPDDRFMKVEDVADTIYAANAISERSVVEEILIRPMLGDI